MSSKKTKGKGHRRGRVTKHAVVVAGPLASLYGLFGMKVGGDNPVLAAQQGRWSDFKSQLKQRVAFWSSADSSASGARAAQAVTWGGALAPAAAPMVRRLPVVHDMNRAVSVKVKGKRW